MTNSKAPWLTRGGAIALMAAAGIALAACSGGGGLNEDEAAGLHQEVEEAVTEAAAARAAQKAAEAAEKAALAAQQTAEAEKLKAETEKTAAETAKAAADDARDAAVAVAQDAQKAAEAAAASAKQAAAALVEAKAAEEQAKVDQKAAEDEAAEAERLRRLAVAAADTEELRRQQAEAEQDRLEQVAEDARQEVNRGQARVALAGLGSETPLGTVSEVLPKRGSTTSLTTTPDLSLRASGAPSIGSPWSGTALTSTTSTHSDNLVVYTNIGPATRVGIQTKHVDFGGDGTPPDDYLGETIDSNDADLIRSSVFPSTENDPREYSNNRESDDAQPPGMDDIYRVNGSYDGASGYFVCRPPSADVKCSVERLGDRYIVGNGTWTFYVRDTATVSQDDQSWMYFGWWKRELLSDGSLLYASFSDGVNSATMSSDGDNDFNDLTGSATYRGPAVGQYAIYQPAGSDSGTGSFRASAVLSANFDTNMLSGTVASFNNDSTWSLALNEASMMGAEVSDSDNGTVTWEIGDATSRVSGSWIAEFFSESPYAGQTPDGVAGTFNAQFDSVGRLIGAFGARK